MQFIQRLLLLVMVFTMAPLVFAEETKPPANYTISIIEPKNEATYRNMETITVRLDIQPALESDDKVSILVDGEPVVEPNAVTVFSLPVLDRGSHVIEAKVIQKNGKGAMSQPITVYQHKASRR